MSKITVGFLDNYCFNDSSIHPKPMKEYAPEWYKNIKTNDTMPHEYFEYKSKVKTIKSCPSFVDVMKEGYVLLAHCDMILDYNSETEEHSWAIAYTWKNEISFDKPIETHGNQQMVNFLPAASNIKHVFKLNMPYVIKTEKGYSCRQIPMPYYFNPDWHISYGVLETDKVHEVNLQINFTTDKKQIVIKKGTPMCVYIPFKRDDYSLEVIDLYENKKLLNEIRGSKHKITSRFRKGYLDVGYWKD